MAPRRTSQEGRGGAKPSDSPRKRGRRERKKKGECESEPKWKSYPLSALCPGRRPRPVSVFRGSLGPPPRVGSAVNSSSAFDAPVFVVGLLPGSPSSSSSRFSPPSLSFSPLSSSLSPTSSTCWGSSFVPPEASASRCFLFSSNCRSVDCLSPRRFFPRLSSHALSALFLVFSLLLPRLQFPRLSPDSRSCRDEAERRPPSSQVFSSDAVASFSQSCGVPGSVASSPLWIFAAADFQPLAGKSELDFQSSPHIQESERDPTPLSALPAAGKATRLAESDRHDEARQRESSVSVYAERVSAGGEDAQRRLQRRGDERSVMLQTTVHLRDEEIPRKPTDAWARSCPKNPHSSAHIHLPADRVLGVEDVTEKCLRYINWYRQQGLTHALRPLEAATALQAEASALARRLSSAHCREDYPFRTPHPLFPGTFDANWFSAKAPDCRSATRTWFSQLRHFNGRSRHECRNFDFRVRRVGVDCAARVVSARRGRARRAVCFFGGDRVTSALSFEGNHRRVHLGQPRRKRVSSVRF
ncbi:hypothetical protein TGGT1_237450 [Toxoplasma gondii GT1]|uniref:Uncharacterized protein n=4 Tax=Toxoplasma gondii TaxID=5811 RepID=S7UQZ6_TOXGG|nr:hypothetical protein TGGT1_237450 [Toxoplasma gondii GT1]KAF4640137.1 hypothetical protein TGRH88_040620 [Toxoplasma gondii]